MKQTWLPLFLIFLCFALAVCNKQPTAPVPLEPGSRNYTWKLDTLYMPMNYISSVWGAAPNDVWATGAGGTEYDRLLHYNGSNTDYLYKYPVAYMSGMNDPIIFEKEVFFCIDNPLGSIYTRNMMLHGILTEDSI